MNDHKGTMSYGADTNERLRNQTSNHIHDYSGATENAGAGILNHSHQFSGSTSGPIMVGNGKHVHRYNNNTTVDRNHSHIMKGTTGVNMDISGGGHIHCGKGSAQDSRGHAHDYKFSTSIVIKNKRRKY